MAVWDELRVVPTELRDSGALMRYPDPRSDRDDPPPYGISLAPWATEVAADLHERFGDDIDLRVGALGYPDRRPVEFAPTPTGPLMDPTEASVELDGPGEIRSGYVLDTGLRVRNLGDTVLEVHTNGQLTALVLDPRSGEVVGGDTRAHLAPLVRFRVAPGEHETIPLIVGTASFVPELGYAVPPGAWEMAADLKLGDGRVVRTPPVPLTITER